MKHRVLFATAELTPIAKVGGLADVAGALPPALTQQGVDVRVVMPRYNTINTTRFPLRSTGIAFTVPFNGAEETVTVQQTTIPDTSVSVYLLTHDGYLSSGDIYTGNAYTDLQRFLFFSKSLVHFLRVIDWQPDVLHCHDWHTGVTPGLVQESADRPATVFTIHNLGYQGLVKPDTAFTLLGITSPESGTWRKTDRRGDLNFLQQAIWSADHLTTVSPRYAQEILTPEYGEGLEGDLKENQNHLTGILNGIDTERFNPATDDAVDTQYTVNDLDMAKRTNKRVLRSELNLAHDDAKPVIGMVTRLADQKGLDLILPVIERIVNYGAQLAILGTGDPAIESSLQEMAKRYDTAVTAVLRFDAALAQRIYAGSDFFLMPSRYEPCGLGQMIAMRYGSTPIVRATGGLADTVPDADADEETGLGFAFRDYTSDALLDAICRAIAAYRDGRWEAIAKRGMQQDFSWDRSAATYATLYAEIIERRAAA